MNPEEPYGLDRINNQLGGSNPNSSGLEKFQYLFGNRNLNETGLGQYAMQNSSINDSGLEDPPNTFVPEDNGIKSYWGHIMRNGMLDIITKELMKMDEEDFQKRAEKSKAERANNFYGKIPRTPEQKAKYYQETREKALRYLEEIDKWNDTLSIERDIIQRKFK